MSCTMSDFPVKYKVNYVEKILNNLDETIVCKYFCRASQKIQPSVYERYTFVYNLIVLLNVLGWLEIY